MQRPPLQWGNLFLGLALSGGVFLFGATFFYLGTIAPQRAVDAAQYWIETPCEIIESSVIAEQSDVESSKPSFVYVIDIHFKYSFAGQERVSDRYDFSILKDGYEDWKRETVARLPPGTKTVCFVNPDNPSEAVIRRGYGPNAGNSLGNYFLWIATVGLMVIGSIGMGFFLVNPLGRAFDKMLQLIDPEYEPLREDNGAAQLTEANSVDSDCERTATIPSDRVRELLRAHGEVRSQDASNWKGDIPLPEGIAKFYREVGPVDITIEGYGSSTLIPSLSQLWDLQADFRGTSTIESLWNRFTGNLFRRWDSNWIVVAIDGAVPVIYSVRDGTILQALPGRGSWEPYEIYPDLNTLAACLAILGSVAIEAGEDLTDDDSCIRPKYLAQAFSRLKEELRHKSAAEAAFGAAGWGEPPRST